MRQCPRLAVLALLTVGLAACAGTKILRDPIPLHVVKPLAVTSTDEAAAALSWVIVRDGAGTWARNADWDEYVVSIRNRSDAPMTLTAVALFDSLGTRVDPATDRRALVRGSRATVRRYRDADLEVRAGMGGAALAATGAVVWYGVAAPAAVAATMGGGTVAGVVGVGAVIAAPVLAVGGILRANNNRKVNNEIQRRRATLPLTLAPGEERTLTLFFPLTPSPVRVELHTTDAVISIGTQDVLAGLHLP